VEVRSEAAENMKPGQRRPAASQVEYEA